MKNTINITKYSGDSVPFDVDKLINSLRRSQASEELIQQIVEQVENQIYDGITTKNECTPLVFVNNELKGWGELSLSKYL